MSYAIKIGTKEVRWIDNEPTPAGHVRFDGAFVFQADGQTLAMVWDDALQNIRPFTQAEQTALEAEQTAAAAEREQARLDRQGLKEQFATDKAKLDAIVDEAAWTNAKRDAALKDLAQVERRILKAVKALVL